MKVRTVLSVVLTVTIIIGTMILAPAINRQMHAWKLLPEPERLTELYFTDHTKLPTSYVPGQTQTVRFTVHNLEYRTTTYHYVITESCPGCAASQTLTRGIFTLGQNQYKKDSVVITLKDVGTRAKVTVSLQGQNESIDYWVNREKI